MNLIVLLVFAIGHFTIDLTSGMAHYGQADFLSISRSDGMEQTILYNTLAFGIQPLLGYLIDRWKIAIYAAIAGCIMVGIGLLILFNPTLSTVFAGAGNALYHLGGGVIILRMFPGKAWPLGVFVGPGALGIGWSRALGANVGYYGAPALTILMFITLLIIFLPRTTQIRQDQKSLSISPLALAIIVLLVLSTFIRSYLGLSISFPWKTQSYMLLMLICAAALGKMAGGFATDRWGRITTSAMALLISAPLLAWGAIAPSLGILGTLLFQTTMAITLLALYEQLPQHPGLAFGLLCFGLWLGVLFTQGIPVVLPASPGYKLVIIIISAIALTAALLLREKQLAQAKIN